MTTLLRVPWLYIAGRVLKSLGSIRPNESENEFLPFFSSILFAFALCEWTLSPYLKTFHLIFIA